VRVVALRLRGCLRCGGLCGHDFLVSPSHGNGCAFSRIFMRNSQLSRGRRSGAARQSV
jgi:hypothetical protein